MGDEVVRAVRSPHLFAAATLECRTVPIATSTPPDSSMAHRLQIEEVVALLAPDKLRGLSEAEARVRNRLVRVLRVPFAENDRSQAERATAGFVKVIASDRGRILGAGVTGREAGEQIALWALVLSAGLGIDDLRSFPAPYPSRAEIARRVAIAFDGPGRAPLRRTGALAFQRRSVTNGEQQNLQGSGQPNDEK